MAPSSLVNRLTINRAKILGKGKYGIVYEGIWGENQVAIKRILVDNVAISNEREVNALKTFDHDNVIKLFHAEEDKNFKCFVLELCKASLDKLFLKGDHPEKYSGPMPPEAEVLLQLAKGLEHIHNNGLVHRDIKPENILIWVNPQTYQVLMKWADFGFSKQVNKRGTFTMSEVKGTFDWLAPEILKLMDGDSSTENEIQKRGTVKSDVFAEGLVFGYFLSGGVHPFGNLSYQIPINVRKMEPTNLPKKKNIRNIIRNMLDKEPEKRIASSDVVALLEEEKKGKVIKMFTLLEKRHRSVIEMEELIEEGVDLNAKDQNGFTPLLLLAENKNNSDYVVEILSLLIKNGRAKINSLDRNGKISLLLSYLNFVAMIHFWVDKGIDINCTDKEGKNALIFLCRNYQNENLIDIIRILIENGIEVNCITKNRYRSNALTLLCEYYQNENLIKIIRLLIENGIKVNCKNKDGDNALTLLCQYYQNENLIDIIRLLIVSGIKVNCENNDGDNALTLLGKHYQNENSIDIIRILIENGIEVNCENWRRSNGLTLLCEYYQSKNLIDIIRLLIEKGIEFHHTNGRNSNALTLLCEHYQNENLIEIIRLLIEKGINVNCKTKYGSNALTLLYQNYPKENLKEILGLLMQSGFELTPETVTFFKKKYHKENRDEILQLIDQQHPDEPVTKRTKF